MPENTPQNSAHRITLGSESPQITQESPIIQRIVYISKVFIVIYILLKIVQVSFLGVGLPLILDQISEVEFAPALSRAGLLLFPFVWLYSVAEGLFVAWFIFMIVKVYQRSKQGFYLMTSTLLLLPLVGLGVMFLLSRVYPTVLTQGNMGVINTLYQGVLETSLYMMIIAIIVVLLLLIFIRKYYNKPSTSLSLKTKVAVLTVFTLSILPSTGYFAFAKITEQTPDESRQLAAQKSGFKLLAPRYLPQDIKMNLRVKELRSKELGITMFRQIFDLPLTDLGKPLTIVILNQGINAKNEEIKDFVRKRKNKEYYIEISLTTAKNNEAYLAKLQTKKEGYSLFFVSKNEIIFELTGVNLTRNAFLKVAESIQ